MMLVSPTLDTLIIHHERIVQQTFEIFVWFQPLGSPDAMLVSRALDVRMVKVSVGVGWHTFKWIYYKDVSQSFGTDMVELLEVGYNGTQFAATECQVTTVHKSQRTTRLTVFCLCWFITPKVTYKVNDRDDRLD